MLKSQGVRGVILAVGPGRLQQQFGDGSEFATGIDYSFDGSNLLGNCASHPAGTSNAAERDHC